MVKKSEAWKDYERYIASIFGGKRIIRPKYISAPDIEHPFFNIECKNHKKIAAVRFYEQAKKYNKKGTKINMVAMHEKSKHSSYIMLSLDDFMNIVDMNKVKQLCKDAITQGSLEVL